jgi:hypothetical protein
VFSALWNEFAWLQVKWAEYLELYGTSPQRINLLNAATGLFFEILQRSLWEDVLLHLCRLTDPAVMRGRQNLSIKALPELCTDTAVRDAVRELVEQAVIATSFARDWRNRHIGHRDRELALGSGTRPLEPASKAQVSAAITGIHRFLNEIGERLLDTTLAADVITPPTGAEALLYVLRDGLDADNERRERIRSGRFTQDDLRHDPI